jgi:DNA repair protein RadC
MDYISIKNWDSKDQPREKLVQHGSRILSDAELIAILLGSGTRDMSAVELARKVLSLSSNNLSQLGRISISELTKVKGIGKAKAITLAAALELGRRRNGSDPEEKKSITSSREASELFIRYMSDLPHEEFWIAFLNRGNRIIEKNILSKGGVSGTITDVRMIMKRAVEVLASSIILCHNHPSGNLNYSKEDLQVTRKISEAASFFDVKLLDHIIVAGNKYFSFADEGLL